MLEPRHVVVPLRPMCPHAELDPRPRHRPRRRRDGSVAVEAVDGPVESATSGSCSRSARSRASSRCPGSPSTDTASATSPTRSPCATTCCGSSRRPTPRRAPDAAERHLAFVFVGAGYAGVEALAELADLVRDALRHYPRLRGVHHAAGCSSTPRRRSSRRSRPGSASTPRRQLERRGVEIHVSTRLESADGDGVLLSDGTRIETCTLVWTTGVRASPALADLGLPLDDRGRVVVDEHLRVAGRDGSGRSATAPRCRTWPPPAGPTRRPPSTRSVRHDGSRGT